MIVDMDEYQRYLDTLTDEELQLIAEKEQMAAEIESAASDGTHTAPRAGTLIGVPGTFTMYQQETDTYCGPACIKSVLMYINGESPSQESIDKAVNRKFSAIPEYVNARQAECYYVLCPDPAVDELTRKIKLDITTFHVPTFLLIASRKPTWPHDTDGHCVLSNGIYDDLSTILIADPLGEKDPEIKYFYEMDADDVAYWNRSICY